VSRRIAGEAGGMVGIGEIGATHGLDGYERIGPDRRTDTVIIGRIQSPW